MENAKKALLNEKMKKVYDRIEQGFISRFNTAEAPKVGTVAYNKAKAEFFAGACNGLLAMLSEEVDVNGDYLPEETINGCSMPVFWIIPLLSGRELDCEKEIV